MLAYWNGKWLLDEVLIFHEGDNAISIRWGTAVRFDQGANIQQLQSIQHA